VRRSTAAAARRQQGHAASVGAEVDVEDFGAKADGKTECSAAFNAALRNISQRGGGVVHARGKGVYVVQPIVLQNNTALQIAVGTFVNATRNCPGKGFPTLMLPRPARCGGAESTASYPPCGTVLFAANVHNFSVRRDERQTGGGKEESAGGLSVCRQLRHTPHVRTNGACVRRTNRTRRGHR